MALLLTSSSVTSIPSPMPASFSRDAVGGCATSVKRILQSQPQVSSANVNLTKEIAVVWPVDEAKVVPDWQKLVVDALANHLTNCGFKSNLQATLPTTATPAAATTRPAATSGPIAPTASAPSASTVPVSVLAEALEATWSEDCRETWGLKLHNASSAEGLLQILTSLENAIKRDILSSNFETTNELLNSSDPTCNSRSLVYVLPWLPRTTSSVALRLMELDSSIFYTLDQKEESQKDRGSLDIAAIPTDYAIVKNVPDYECAALVYYIQDINEEWISDKTRFCYDGLKRQRLNDPMIRGADGRFKAVSWRDALAVVAEVIHQVKPAEVVGVAGKLSDAESMMALKDFLNRVGSNNVWCEGNGPNPNADLRSGYLLNTGISGLEKADAFLLVGTQPRVEAAMINARIRKTVRATQAKVGYIGPPTDFNYDHQHLGTGPETLTEIASGKHPFSSVLSNAKNPAIIVGAGIFERKDQNAILSLIESIAKKGNIITPEWNGLNLLLLNAAQAAALDLGLIPESDKSIETAKFVYLMGADDINLDKLPKDAFVLYQGHHGDKGVYRANVILPSAAFSEKEGTYENTEGCAQQTLPAVPTVGDARDDWKIIRALSEVTGFRLPYDSLGGIHSRMRTVAPNLLHTDEREPAIFSPLLKPECSEKISNEPFGAAVDNFYMTDAITRASKIMAQCSSMLSKK